MNHIICIVLLFLLPMITAQKYPFAFYTLSMNTANTVKVFSGNATGYITYVDEVPTGGAGAAVQSQQSICVYGGYLFAVNPNSNTVSLFSISNNDPTNIKLVGTPVSSGGTYPLSVTAYGGIAAVVNSGDKNGIRTFTYGPSGLVPVSGSDRNLNLSLTNPPVSHTGPAQISFTPDGTGLIVSNKNASPPLFYFKISANGIPSATPATSLNVGMVPFGFTFTADGNVVLTDAAPTGTSSGVIVAYINPYPQGPSFLTPSYYLIRDQQASCWISFSSRINHFYVSNLASGNVTELSLTGFAELNNYAVPEPLDSIVATVNSVDYLYVLSKSSAVYVFSLNGSGATWIETAVVPSTTAIAGTAVYVSKPSTRHDDRNFLGHRVGLNAGPALEQNGGHNHS
jgi:hypothetical protein